MCIFLWKGPNEYIPPPSTICETPMGLMPYQQPPNYPAHTMPSTSSAFYSPHREPIGKSFFNYFSNLVSLDYEIVKWVILITMNKNLSIVCWMLWNCESKIIFVRDYYEWLSFWRVRNCFTMSVNVFKFNWKRL